MSWRLQPPVWRRGWSLDDKGIPKLELGNEGNESVRCVLDGTECRPYLSVLCGFA